MDTVKQVNSGLMDSVIGFASHSGNTGDNPKSYENSRDSSKCAILHCHEKKVDGKCPVGHDDTFSRCAVCGRFNEFGTCPKKHDGCRCSICNKPTIDGKCSHEHDTSVQ